MMEKSKWWGLEGVQLKVSNGSSRRFHMGAISGLKWVKLEVS